MRHKYLYILMFAVILTGCGGHMTAVAPVEEPGRTRPPIAGESPSVSPSHRSPAQPEQSVRPTSERSEVLFLVLSSIGVDYAYGGNSHTTGFDCSGLVAHVFREGYGVSLPRTSVQQSQVGNPVSADDLQPGDLVFYNTLNRPYSHVGIYLGDGRFVHAPKTGATVRIENLQSSYWSRRWNGARRIVAQN